MAKDRRGSSKRRKQAIRNRSEVKNPKTGLWVKRDSVAGKFKDTKTSGGKFKGVRGHEGVSVDFPATSHDGTGRKPPKRETQKVMKKK